MGGRATARRGDRAVPQLPLDLSQRELFSSRCLPPACLSWAGKSPDRFEQPIAPPLLIFLKEAVRASGGRAECEHFAPKSWSRERRQRVASDANILASLSHRVVWASGMEKCLCPSGSFTGRMKGYPGFSGRFYAGKPFTARWVEKCARVRCWEWSSCLPRSRVQRGSRTARSLVSWDPVGVRSPHVCSTASQNLHFYISSLNCFHWTIIFKQKGK